MVPQRSFTVSVIEVVRETADTHSIVLVPAAADAHLFDFEPGQFLTLQVPSEQAGGAARPYALSGSGPVGEPMRVTVRRKRGGYASNWICDHLRVGDQIDVLPPEGTFGPTAVEDRDLLLVAEEIGVASVMSLLAARLRAGRRRVTLLYVHAGASVLFGEELAALERRYDGRLDVLHLSDPGPLATDAEVIRARLAGAPGPDVVVCGPPALLDVATRAAADAGVPAARLWAQSRA
ncbi:hypothetical protein FHP29_00115 [Nocardioides albidus]|uniref:FAD-binding FR-type domain-containing protein n=2 Tax=Nocardioides albidus TaxID=1517589 RepID=A0A5C4WTJ5_9ACTN|nr:hypothetical protein FHP29_00115 [Nocardioides albidus]